MTQQLKVMCVHGLGDHRKTPWKEDWQDAISKIFAIHGNIELEFSFLTYDPIFEHVNLSAWEAMREGSCARGQV